MNFDFCSTSAARWNLQTVGKPLLFLAFAILLAIGVSGFLVLADYSYRPAVSTGNLALTFPVNFSPKDGSKCHATDSLVLFYHPHCPCTRATIRNLERFLGASSSRPDVVAYAYRPEGEADHWIESEQTELLRSIPGVEIFPDPNGQQCDLFGVSTSGHVLVYDSGGNLKYSGGITASRGHEGDSLVGQRFVESLNQVSTKLVQQPVFGCSIVESKGGQ